MTAFEFTVILHGRRFCESNVQELAKSVRKYIEDFGWGASDTGGSFKVCKNAKPVGTLAYNGKYTAY